MPKANALPNLPYRGWMPMPESALQVGVLHRVHGERLLLLRGTRWRERPDGSVERAREVFAEDDVRSVRMPSHLGGGFLFYAPSPQRTWLWRAPAWTAPLTALGEIRAEVAEAVPGLDRLYLRTVGTSRLSAMDWENGEPTGLGALPVASSYGDLAFASAWTGVVVASGRGPLATFDAGDSWHPVEGVPINATFEVDAGGEVQARVDRRRLLLTGQDEMTVQTLGGGDPFDEAAREPYPIRWPPRQAESTLPPADSPRWLRWALLQGVADSDSTALVVHGGSLHQVSLDGGVLLSTRRAPTELPCRGIRLGHGVGFACGAAPGPLQVFRYAPDSGLVLEKRFARASGYLSSEHGAFAAVAPCGVDAGSLCKRLPGGRYEAVDFPKAIRKWVPSSALLADGGVAVLQPPGPGSEPQLWLLRNGKVERFPLQLEGSQAQLQLARAGRWLAAPRELAPGTLGVWIVGSRDYLGLTVQLDEAATKLGSVRHGLHETAFDGPRAVQVVASSTVRESTDQGQTWRSFDLPPMVHTQFSSQSAAVIRGCSPLGCVWGDWGRVGYGGEDPALEPPPPSKRTRSRDVLSSFSFWSLHCHAAAKQVSPPQVVRNNTARPPSTPEVLPPGADPRLFEPTSWLGFQGTEPPPAPHNDIAYDRGEIGGFGGYRAYAWGPALSPWTREGRWSITVSDRFAVGTPWQTQTGTSPFPDAVAAARAFGMDPLRGADWQLQVAAGGQHAVLRTRVRGEAAIHLLEPGSAPITLSSVAVEALGRDIDGVSKVAGQWFVGSSQPDSFLVYEVDGSELSLRAELPTFDRVPRSLVATSDGRRLAVWQRTRDQGWFFNPLHPDSLQPEPAMQVDRELLSLIPSSCEDGLPGYQVVAGVPLTDVALSESNINLEFEGKLRVRRVGAQLRVRREGICLERLAALRDSGTIRSATGQRSDVPTASRIPLVVTDADTEEVGLFRCAP